MFSFPVTFYKSHIRKLKWHLLIKKNNYHNVCILVLVKDPPLDAKQIEFMAFTDGWESSEMSLRTRHEKAHLIKEKKLDPKRK